MEKLYLPDAPVLVGHDDLLLFHEEMFSRPVVDTLLGALTEAYESDMLDSIYRMGELFKRGRIPIDTSERRRLEAQATAIEKGMALGLTAIKFCVPEMYLELLPEGLENIVDSINTIVCDQLTEPQKAKRPPNSDLPHIKAMFDFGNEGLKLIPGIDDAVEAYLPDITGNDSSMDRFVKCGVGIAALASVATRQKAIDIEGGHILGEAGLGTPAFDEGIQALIDEPEDTPRLQELPPR